MNRFSEVENFCEMKGSEQPVEIVDKDFFNSFEDDFDESDVSSLSSSGEQHPTQSHYLTSNPEQIAQKNILLKKDNEINIPADGDCLYSTVFVGYLLPVINDESSFRERLIKIIGDNTDSETLRKILIHGHKNIENFKKQDFKSYILKFRKYIDLNDGKWGGPDEIKIISERLGIAIQEVYKNPDFNQSENPYILSDLVRDEEQQNLSNLEKIFILRTNPKPEEALRYVDDVAVQIAKIESTNTSKNLQHYRLVATVPTILDEAISDTENMVEELDNLKEDAAYHNIDAIRFARTYSSAAEMLQTFDKLFYPQQFNSSQGPIIDSDSQLQILQLLTGHQDPTSLLVRTNEFLADTPSILPQLKSIESKTFQEIMLRTGMLKRPEYFTSLSQAEQESSNADVIISSKFLQEFVHSGALDHHLQNVKETPVKMDGLDQEAALEFINMVANFLKHLASDDINNPKLDPLNKYVDPEDIDYIIKAEEWLKNNPDHPEYDNVQQEYSEVIDSIRENRGRAMQEGADYMFSLLKRMDPKLHAIESKNDLMKLNKEKWKQEKNSKFEKYILEEFKLFDIFEPNQIRSLWEILYRQQYGKIFYRYVCKSFEPQYKDSKVHQAVYQIWAISLIDTIHYQPQEAKSRMPNASIDGLTAPNFGYAIERSPAFQSWITNPLVRATADIIIDAFHYVVDFGRNLNIDTFLERLQIHLSDDEKIKQVCFESSHLYDSFMIDFELYLLEKIYHNPFVSDGKRKITTELINTAGENQKLIEDAKQALAHFVYFSEDLFALRISNEPLSKKDSLGAVFGIGYNGKKFNSINHTNIEKHKILLTFCESFRNKKGYLLFLVLLKHAVKNQNESFFNSVVNSLGNVKDYFAKYQFLIKSQVDLKIKYFYSFPDLECSKSHLEYRIQQRTKFEGFMAQLEQDLSFNQLTHEFKNWIQNISNWYYIPSDISIEIPKDMPKEEYKAQELAREFLFDALAKRPFSTKYIHSLMPLLFLHWKKNIAELLLSGEFDDVINNSNNSSQHSSFWNHNNNSTTFDKRTVFISAIEKAQSLDELLDQFKDFALILLDNLIWKVHPVLESIWKPGINKDFESFMQDKPEVKNLVSELRKAESALKKMDKNLKKNINQDARENLTKKSEEQEKIIKELKDKTAKLPTTPAALTEKEYENFKNKFFEGRDVAQCIEPVFARVLGHDRFFSVFISKKIRETVVKDETSLYHRPLQLGNRIPQDVIAPCHKRCQHHALGHLYTGDLLSYQSADRLDEIRQTHNLGAVPDRIMTFKK